MTPDQEEPSTDTVRLYETSVGYFVTDEKNIVLAGKGKEMHPAGRMMLGYKSTGHPLNLEASNDIAPRPKHNPLDSVILHTIEDYADCAEDVTILSVKQVAREKFEALKAAYAAQNSTYLDKRRTIHTSRAISFYDAYTEMMRHFAVFEAEYKTRTDALGPEPKLEDMLSQLGKP